MATWLSNQLERSAQLPLFETADSFRRNYFSWNSNRAPREQFYPDLAMTHDGVSFFPPNNARLSLEIE